MQMAHLCCSVGDMKISQVSGRKYQPVLFRCLLFHYKVWEAYAMIVVQKLYQLMVLFLLFSLPLEKRHSLQLQFLN